MLQDMYIEINVNVIKYYKQLNVILVLIVHGLLIHVFKNHVHNIVHNKYVHKQKDVIGI